MFCSNCGQTLPNEVSFCSKCGKPQRPGVKPQETKYETCEIILAPPWELLSVEHLRRTFFGTRIYYHYVYELVYSADAYGPKGQYCAGYSKKITAIVERTSSWMGDNVISMDPRCYKPVILLTHPITGDKVDKEKKRYEKMKDYQRQQESASAQEQRDKILSDFIDQLLREGWEYTGESQGKKLFRRPSR